MRSLATRRAAPRDQRGARRRARTCCKYAGFDLIVVETAGIGQSDSEIVDLVDVPVYVMTSEYGAASQLEKIDMLDFADLIVLNKFEKRGAEDALRDVRKQWRRNHVAFQVRRRRDSGVPDDREPVQRPGRQPAVRGAAAERLRRGRRAAAALATRPIPVRRSCVARHALIPGAARALSRGDRGQRPARPATSRGDARRRGEPRPAASTRRSRRSATPRCRRRSSAIRPPRSPTTRPTPH